MRIARMPDVSWDKQKERFVINWRYPKAVDAITGLWFRDRFPKNTTPAQAAKIKAERLIEFNSIIDAAKVKLGTIDGMSEAIQMHRKRFRQRMDGIHAGIATIHQTLLMRTWLSTAPKRKPRYTASPPKTGSQSTYPRRRQR